MSYFSGRGTIEYHQVGTEMGIMGLSMLTMFLSYCKQKVVNWLSGPDGMKISVCATQSAACMCQLVIF